MRFGSSYSSESPLRSLRHAGTFFLSHARTRLRNAASSGESLRSMGRSLPRARRARHPRDAALASALDEGAARRRRGPEQVFAARPRGDERRLEAFAVLGLELD